MNRREHYAEAERLITKAGEMLDDALAGKGPLARSSQQTAANVISNTYALAQVHASLAGVTTYVAGETEF